jgi:exodeoxyribonuclease V beta subunit
LGIEQVLAFPLHGVQLIEASAGTGKTYTIANLYLRHIIAGREVGQVLVVTFTTAATDELRGRIRARLFEALTLLDGSGRTDDVFLAALVAQIRRAGEEQQALIVRRLRLAVRAMDEAAIYTIHSFCQRALTEFAFNSGQRFQLEVLTNDQPLWRAAVHDWWRTAGYRLDAAHARLFAASLGDLAAFRGLLAPLLGAQHKRLLPEVGPLPAVLARLNALEPELAEIAQHWRRDGDRLAAILRDSKALSRAQKSPYHPQRLATTLTELDAYFDAQPLPPPPDAFAVLGSASISANRLKKPDPLLDDAFFARCGQLVAELAALSRDLRVAALADAAAFARERVRALKAKAQLLSFDDLLTELQAALQGARGAALADAIRAQFPVAMIDEFQDTDPVQYGIFRTLYRDRPDCGLIMIGDPKQAIYSFRGGDIFTYMQAKADLNADLGDGGLYTLETNWRSTPSLINAVNQVFRRRGEDAFVYRETITFAPVVAAERPHRGLSIQGRAQPALRLWTLPLKDDGKARSKQDAGSLTHAAVAAEIARLIDGGRRGEVRLGERPLLPKDIAVLVRTGYEAAELRSVLAGRGINAVSVGRESVFQSPEAGALETLLAAVLSPRDRDLARLALGSPLLGREFVEIERVCRGEDEWAAWADGLRQLHESWQRKGFMPMFQQMLSRMGIAAALARGELGERRLTNLLHLGELLQQAYKVHAGMDGLLGWYSRQRAESLAEAAAEDTELRLESDEELVQIVTIHASKGLEYPVVFVPYLWSCKPRGTGQLLAFHLDGQACLDAGSDAIEAHRLLAEQERLAEDLRLVYVALTRAASALYLVWGRAGSNQGHAGQTALGYLLHPHQDAGRLAVEPPDAFAAAGDLQTQLQADLQQLADAADGDIVPEPLPMPLPLPLPQRQPQSGGHRPALAEQPDAPLDARPFTGRIASDWRVASFSALTRDLHPGLGTPSGASRDQVEDDPALRFPAGSHVGSYLHLLLERLDFQADVARQVLEQSAQIAPRFNLDHRCVGADAALMLERVVQTSLDANGLCLADLPMGKRLNELSFDLATRRVDIGALNRLLEQAAGEALPPLEVETFQGMLTGVIDLVFEHRGRYYIADYKSNFLGGRLEHYRPEALRTAVFERRYDLQYLLYTLALHRFLGTRLPGYCYQQHVGGVYYLFLRGMRPASGPEAGVYFDRPAGAVIETLDRQVFAWDEEGRA